MQQFLYFFGHGFCHQIPSRSFAVDGLFFSACARDTGIYLGLALAVVVALLLHLCIIEKPSGMLLPPMVVVCGLLAMPMAIDAVTSYLGWRTTTNGIRYVTGLLAGIGLGTLLVPLCFALRQRSHLERPVYPSPVAFCLHLALTLSLCVVFYLVYPLLGLAAPLIALLAFFAIILLLNILILALFDRLSPNGSLRRFLLLSALALALALAEIALLGWLRDLIVAAIR
jgi:uncharacterized membrane protein